MNNIIFLDNLSLEFENGIYAFKNISFSMNAGEYLGIIGPNGGGKSSLLKVIAGLIAPTKGELEISKEGINNLVWLPQILENSKLLPLTLEDLFKTTVPQSTIEERCNVLEMTGIKGKETDLFTNLSGGERQRALLSLAMLLKPKILLMDEPTQGLDSIGQGQFLQILKKLKSLNEISIIHVDHNIGMMKNLSDRILCLNKEFHWHDRSDLCNHSVISSIYHCEFEHQLIHDEYGIEGVKHTKCNLHEKFPVGGQNE